VALAASAGAACLVERDVDMRVPAKDLVAAPAERIDLDHACTTPANQIGLATSMHAPVGERLRTMQSTPSRRQAQVVRLCARVGWRARRSFEFSRMAGQILKGDSL
jgi:hypothetical protein